MLGKFRYSDGYLSTNKKEIELVSQSRVLEMSAKTHCRSFIIKSEFALHNQLFVVRQQFYRMQLVNRFFETHAKRRNYPGHESSLKILRRGGLQKVILFLRSPANVTSLAATRLCCLVPGYLTISDEGASIFRVPTSLFC